MSRHGAWLKEAVKNLFREFGLDVRSLKYANTEATVISSLLRLAPPAVVVDVGANIGQFGTNIRREGYLGPIVSFEALRSVHSQLMALAAADGNWIVAPCAALGSRRAEMAINISANTVSSSLMAMTEVVWATAPEATYVGMQTVEVIRLDEIFRELFTADGDIYLKVDTQGYEQEVLKGSTALFPRIAVMQLELSLIPLYASAPTFSEMVAYVESLGYELFSLVPGFRSEATGRILQVDGFFVRKAPVH